MSNIPAAGYGSNGNNGFQPPEIVCGAEDLKVMLSELSRQFADSDRRNLNALRDMQSRLQHLGQDADSVRDQVPDRYASAFARIEDGVQSLAARIGEVGRERELAQSSSAPTSEPDLFAPHNGHATQAAAMPANYSADGNASEPWDAHSAEALAQMYESGIADVALVAAPVTQPIKPVASQFAPAPAFAVDHATVGAPAPQAMASNDGDRAWLDERFAAIAERIEYSISGMRPAESEFGRLDERLSQLEAHFSAALEDVATRADVDGLRIVEAHINELAAQFERAEQQLQRLDQIERQIGDVASQLTDERIASIAAQLAPAGHPGPTEEDVEAVAMAVADRVASMLPAPAAQAHDQNGAAELKRVVESFAAGQRETEEHTATMLDTMQQALIRMLDRMDALENASSSYAAPQVDFVPAAAAPVAPVPAPAATAPQPAAAPSRLEPSFAATMQPSGMQEPMAEAASTPQPAAHVRATAAADARRAAQKMAAQAQAGSDMAAPVEGSRVRRGAPSVQISVPDDAGPEVKARSRAPLMVAGVALIAAVGILAASVGFSRGGLVGSAQTVAKGKLSIDNGQAEGVEKQGASISEGGGTNVATDGQPQIAPTPSIEIPDKSPRPAPAATAPRPGASADPRSLSQPSSDMERSAAPVQKAAVRQEVGAAGMLVTQNGTIPADSDLARARQQRNMSSLANQLAALQANPNSVPPSLLPEGMVAPQGQSETGAVEIGEMPPAAIGPNSLRVAAQKGDPSAEFEVAARFAEGRGIGQDFKQAMTWYQRSAQRGFAPAQYRLGTLYERGVGTKADIARAKIWYGRAAEQGHVKAMHNLAVLNAGRDAAADYVTARHWFTAAADRGLADSQYNLGVLFESGLGLQRDYKQAYHWLSLAARGGDKDAARRRDQVRMKLEESEVAGLDQAVEAWRATPVDSTVNDPRVAGETWKSRQAANR